MSFFKKVFGGKNKTPEGGITYSTSLKTNKEEWIETNKDSIYDVFLQSVNKNIIPEDSIDLPIKDCKVFVLEDQKDTRDILTILLDNLGTEKDNICFAKNVDEAKQLRWDNHFDLAILDYNIDHSKLTGSDFLMRLIQERYPDGINRPVIIGNSSWSADGWASQNLFFTNPFIQDQLKKYLLSSEELRERIQWAMKKMNIHLLYDT